MTLIFDVYLQDIYVHSADKKVFNFVLYLKTLIFVQNRGDFSKIGVKNSNRSYLPKCSRSCTAKMSIIACLVLLEKESDQAAHNVLSLIHVDQC